MSLSDVLRSLSEEMSEGLKRVVSECHEIRTKVSPGSITEGPTELHERLLTARHAQDRAEMIVAELGRLHSRASIAVADLRGRLEDAEASAELPPAEDYSTARERNARLSLAVVDERIAVRRATRQKEEVWEALEYCRLLHRGIDGSRRDLDLRIRLLSMQTMLER